MPIILARAGARPRTVAVTAPLALTLLLAGCATVHRPPTTVDELLRARTAQADADRRERDALILTLADRAARRGDGTLDILLLSGGGQNGAYGAAFLRAWAARRDAPMPRFDLVTGISTGALQSPFAFLGTPDALDSLVQFYRTAPDRIAPSVDWFSGLRPTGGVFRMTKLQRTLEAVVDSSFEAKLRAGFAESRRLLVGSADLDLGTARTWDLARALDGTATGRARAVQLLRASSAIPGIFPPIVLDGRVHGDGGVADNVLVPLLLDDYARLAEALRARGTTAPVTVRLWLVLNVWTALDVQVTNPADVLAIGNRGRSFLFGVRQGRIAEELRTIARAVNGSVPGVRVEFRHTAIPAEVGQLPGANALFDRAFMARLDRLGAERGAAARMWDGEEVPGR